MVSTCKGVDLGIRPANTVHISVFEGQVSTIDSLAPAVLTRKGDWADSLEEEEEVDGEGEQLRISGDGALSGVAQSSLLMMIKCSMPIDNTMN